MTQITMGNEEYRRLLREWCYLEIHDLTCGLTKDDYERLKELNALLEQAELAEMPHSQEVRA